MSEKNLLYLVIVLFSITASADSAADTDLKTIMQGLQNDAFLVLKELLVEDHDAIANAAGKIADHPRLPPEQVAKVAAELGSDMAAFKQIDTVVHDLSLAIRSAALLCFSRSLGIAPTEYWNVIKELQVRCPHRDQYRKQVESARLNWFGTPWPHCNSTVCAPQFSNFHFQALGTHFFRRNERTDTQFNTRPQLVWPALEQGVAAAEQGTPQPAQGHGYYRCRLLGYNFVDAFFKRLNLAIAGDTALRKYAQYLGFAQSLVNAQVSTFKDLRVFSA